MSYLLTEAETRLDVLQSPVTYTTSATWSEILWTLWSNAIPKCLPLVGPIQVQNLVLVAVGLLQRGLPDGRRSDQDQFDIR